MNPRIMIAVAVGFLASQLFAQDRPGPAAAKKTELKSLKEKASYSIGWETGKRLKAQPVELEVDLMVKGLRDAMSGGKGQLSDDDIHQVMQDFQKQVVGEMASRNKKEGEAFLTANKGREGIKSTKSGLQYKIVKKGTGKKPTAEDTVVTHYRGTLINGQEFDSSYKRGQPATFQVSGVIPGWIEALQLMDEGAKWQIFVPSELAYGEHGNGEIGPNSTLIFEIELVKIGEPDAEPILPRRSPKQPKGQPEEKSGE